MFCRCVQSTLMFVSVSAAAEEEAGRGTQCTAEGGGSTAHHADQLRADCKGSPESAWTDRDASV